MTSQDKSEVEKIIKQQLKTFMDSTQVHKKVIDIVLKELGVRKIDDKIIDLSTKVVVELFKTLWQRKSFWEGALKGLK